jgi:putative flippase GtrA
MKQFSWFLAVGMINTLFGYLVIFCCMYLLQLSPEFSNIIGYGFGLLLSYRLHRNYTFKSSQEQRREFIRFLGVFFLSYGANFAVLVILINSSAVHEGLSQLLAGLVYIGTFYLLNKYYVFRVMKVR